MTGRKIQVRQARRQDFPEIHNLIKSKSSESQETEVRSVEQLIHDGIDSNPPKFYCLVATDSKKQIVGFIVYTFTYSTWEARMLFMQNLFCQPGETASEIERELVRHMCQIAVEKRCSRIQYHDKKDSALSRRLNALDITVVEKWHQYRLPRTSFPSLIDRF